jgi:hypothetical protein
MNNLTAGIDSSSGFLRRMYRLYRDISGVTELRSRVAESIGIRWRIASEYAASDEVILTLVAVSPYLTFLDLHEHPRTFSNQSYVRAALYGFVKEGYTLAVIGPDKSSTYLFDGTVCHVLDLL